MLLPDTLSYVGSKILSYLKKQVFLDVIQIDVSQYFPQKLSEVFF